MLIGYARVSTQDQNINLQKDALEKAGCEAIYCEVSSGSKADRPELKKAISYAREGDTLVVWKLDRLGRSIQHLIDLVNQLQERKIGFKSLQENIDTTTSGGKLIFHIFSALAEFERDIIRERTKAGLQAARARGRKGGRPKGLDVKKIKLAKKLHKDKNYTIKEICETLNISKSSLYNYLKTEVIAE